MDIPSERGLGRNIPKRVSVRSSQGRGDKFLVIVTLPSAEGAGGRGNEGAYGH